MNANQNRFHYLGREITLANTDIFHWKVQVDDQPLYAMEGEEVVFKSKRDAQTAGFEFVRKLAEDEGMEVEA